MPPATATPVAVPPPATAPLGLHAHALRERALFVVFFGFMLVALHLVRDPTTFDKTLVPRLLALAGFLLALLPTLPWLTAKMRLDAAVLRDPIVLCSAAYAAITALSLAFAVNVTAGFTDVFKTFTACLVLGLSALLLPIVPRWQERLVKLFVVAAAISATIGWVTTIQRHGLGFHDRSDMERVTGLMSSANLYAHYLDLLLPICLVGAVILGGVWRAAAAVVSAGVAALLVLLQTRSAYVGLAAGLAAGLCAAVAFPAPLGLSKRMRNALVSLFLGGLGAVGTFVATAPDTNPVARRVRSIVVEPQGPGARPREGGRLVIWDLTRRMIADHPLTGVGAGNFTIRLHEYFDADFQFARIHTTNWTQPHNDPLWVWAEKGVFGLAAFVGIFGAALAAIRSILKSSPTRTDAWLAVGILVSLVASTVGSLFDFPLERVSHQVTLAVLLAAVVVMRRQAARASDSLEPPAPRPVPWRLILPPALAILGLAATYAAAARRQEQAVVKAMLAEDAGDWQGVVNNARQAATPWRTLDPVSMPVAVREGMAHLHLGRKAEALACLEQARRENPNRMQILNNLGVLYADAGDYERAIECFGLVVDRYPNRIEGFQNLANCYFECGHAAEAVALLEEIPESLRTDAIRENLAKARAAVAAPDIPDVPDAANAPDAAGR
jgi:O-antigen ligase